TMSYAWSNGGTGASISVSPTVNTTYTVTATATVGGCIATTTKQVSVAITDEPEITSISTPAAVCDGETLSLSTPTVTNHGSAVSAQGWQISANGSTYSSFNSSTAVTYSQNGNYIRYYATNTCGTVYSNTIQITVNDRPSVSPITAPDAICVGEPLDLTTPTVTTNGSSITAEGWEISSSQNGTYTPFTNSNLQQNQDGYYIRYTAANACGSSSNTGVQITVNAPSISITSTYDYVWRGGTSNWNIASNWYEYNNGTYTVASALPAEAKNYYIALGGTGTCLNDVQQAYMNADATVNTIEIAPGAEVHIQENVTLQLAGSIINNGTFVADNSSTIELNGAADQTLTSAMEFGNVTFAQTANNKKIIAPHGITVHGLATFTKGVVDGDMTFVTGATSSGANLASHVDGQVTKFGNGAFTFPTGSNGVLGTMEATIANNSRAGINLRFNNASADGHGFSTDDPDNYPRWWNINDMCSADGGNRFDHVNNFEFWNVDGIAGSTSLSSITIKVDANTASAHFHDAASVAAAVANSGGIHAAAHYDCWKNIGGTANVENEGKTITVTGISSINYIRSGTFGGILTLGSTNENTVLPIELTSFKADCDGKSALVAWTTATERNNDYFVLERSADAIDFIEVARVAGAGNSIESLDYAYADYGVHGGDNYYRLVQVDYDGSRTVSEIIVANCVEPSTEEPDVQAYPNPFDGELTVVLDNFGNRPARIDVYDVLGKLIYTEKIASPLNSYETILHFENLPPATYTIRVSTADFVINRKVIKD
ncbi:MAG: T9SS type A sorting domain-containing protein, partial [Bacteroidales bacterium]|nr:T9SS type A sorting domain-containing protein [Bacteroidales bacterium]